MSAAPRAGWESRRRVAVLFAAPSVPGWSLVADRLLVLVQLQPLAGPVAVVLHEVRVVQGPLLRLDRLVEVADLRIRGRERVEEPAVLVLDHLHRFLALLHGPLAIAEL